MFFKFAPKAASVFKLARGFLLARRFHFIIELSASKPQPISVIFGVLNKEYLNFGKLLVLGQTSSTIKR